MSECACLFARAAERRGALFLFKGPDPTFLSFAGESCALVENGCCSRHGPYATGQALRSVQFYVNAISFNRSVFKNFVVFSFGVCACALPRVLALSGLGATESLIVSVAQQ